LLVLTGRFSYFKASALLSPEFVHTLQNDYIHHWRYGRIKMLTGDDKSSWFHLLKYNWNMLYLPDVYVYCLEESPDQNFVVASLGLMKRWFGNMLRNNSRAIQLGYKKVGFFTWLCLIDQRISLWTTLTGPVFVTLYSFVYTPMILLTYFIWVMITRTLNCFLTFIISRQFHPLFIFILWYEQMFGSALKVYVSFRLNRQKWTRQSVNTGDTQQVYLTDVLLPRLLTLGSVLALILGISFLHGL
ncbi:MAG: alginate biosynthesis protein Alg8, partial [Vibrio sp.]